MTTRRAADRERETFPVESSDGQNSKAQEDYLQMVYGDFLQSDDVRLHYHRKVLGVLSLQVLGNLALNCICARVGGLNDLGSNIIVFAAAAFATIGSVVMMVINEENRKSLPKAHMLAAAFIIGSCFLTLGLTQSFNDQFTLLLLYALATAVVSLFAGALFAKTRQDAEWYMQIAGAAGGAVTTLMVPFYLAHWYGEDYSMMWVLWTVILNVVVAYYVYYDLLEYQDETLIENDDYLYATLRVYIDWIWIIFYAFLKFIWNRGTSSE